MSKETKQAYKYKHTKRDGEPNFLNYSYEIALLKTHKERIDYLSDLDEKYHNSVYLTCMQMGLAQTISRLPIRAERKKAWEDTTRLMNRLIQKNIINKKAELPPEIQKVKQQIKNARNILPKV